MVSRKPPGLMVVLVPGVRVTRTTATAPPYAVSCGVDHAPVAASKGTRWPLRKSSAAPVLLAGPTMVSVPRTPQVSSAGVKVVKKEDVSPAGEPPSVSPSTSAPGGSGVPAAPSWSGMAHGPPTRPTRYAQGVAVLGHAEKGAFAAAAAPGVQFTMRMRLPRVSAKYSTWRPEGAATTERGESKVELDACQSSGAALDTPVPKIVVTSFVAVFIERTRLLPVSAISNVPAVKNKPSDLFSCAAEPTPSSKPPTYEPEA